MILLAPRSFLSRSSLFLRYYSSKKSSSSTKWLQRASKDHYTKAARFNDYKSRAAFKLVQLDNKYKILQPGNSVVDLGFAPGAWSQVAVARTKPDGIVLGVDIIPTEPPKGASAMQANILSMKTHKLIRSFFLEQKQHQLASKTRDLLDQPSYIATEMAEDAEIEPTELSISQQFPIDVVISDMYAPIEPPERVWNNMTNSAFNRMANTTGLAVRDHSASINLCDAALILAIDLLKPGGAFICKFYTGPEDAGLEHRLRNTFAKVFRDKPDACRPESKECYFIGLGKFNDLDKHDVFSQ